jgi:predicted nucleotidyltransferase
MKREFGAERAIMFGSRARGDWLTESDYDFLVVSRRFEDVHFSERPVPLYQYWRKWPGVELLRYTPQEYDRKRGEIGIVQEATGEGVEL